MNRKIIVSTIASLILILLSISTESSSLKTKKPQLNEPDFDINTILNDKEKEWIKNHKTIRVGHDPNWAPFEFFDKNGESFGINIEYIKYIASVLNLKIEFIKTNTWQETLDNIKNKDVDLLTGVSQTPDRLDYMSFTKPYITNPISVFAHEDITHIRNLDELNNKKVAIVKGYFIEEVFEKKHPQIELVFADSPKEALKLVKKKKVFAYVDGMISGGYYIKENNLHSIRLVGETPYSYQLSIGIRNDWSEMTSIVQKVLNNIPESEKNNIYYNWISLNSNNSFRYDLLLRLSIPLSIILLLIFFWNRKLRREIKRREQAQLDLNFAFKELKDTQTHLVQTEKMATVGQLTAGVAHEIKNPLNFIMMGMEGVINGIDAYEKIIDAYESLKTSLSKEELEKIEQLKEKLDYNYFRYECDSLSKSIAEGAESIHEITKSLNNFSYFSGKEKVLADVNKGLESTLVLLKNQYKYKAEVEIDLGKLPEIKCFPGKLNQVYVNLISNATQAIEDQGKIEISTFLENNFVVISIKDNGKGMSKDQLDKIFNPFYTTKPIGKGTGLGLPISKNIIDEHEGRIIVDSEQGVGTEFKIYLPIITE